MGGVVAYNWDQRRAGAYPACWKESAKPRPVTAAQLDDLDLQRAIASLPVPLLLISRDRRCIFANPAMAWIFDLPGSALLDQHLSDLVPEGGVLADHAFNLLDAGNNVPVQHEHNFRGRRYQLSASHLHGPGEEVRAMIVAAVDVTRRWRTEQSLRRSRRRLVECARRDHLTGLLNRRGWDTLLRREAFLASRDGKPLSVFIADVDWFKSYNDKFGHLAGDQCLRLIAAELRRCVGSVGGYAGRYGGEEFVAVLPGSSGTHALAVAERFRSAVAALEVEHRNRVVAPITVSIGVAAFDLPSQYPSVSGRDVAILKAADEALYTAMGNGRDQVRCAPFRGLPGRFLKGEVSLSI